MVREHTVKNGVEGKECSTCEQWMPLSEYATQKRGYRGRRAKCRACHRKVYVAWSQTERGRASIRKAQQKYYNSEKDLARCRRIYQTEKWRATNRRSVRAWCKRNPTKKKAAHAVCYAVSKGLLPKVSSCLCSDCDIQAEEYHHESYKKEHWLDVTPLCRRCHMVRHDRIAS